MKKIIPTFEEYTIVTPSVSDIKTKDNESKTLTIDKNDNLVDEAGFVYYAAAGGIGQRILLKTKEIETNRAFIRAIIHTNAKVRYSIFLEKSKTTLHNIDSVYIKEIYDDFIKFETDNYS